jgi:hypothetical protein
MGVELRIGLALDASRTYYNERRCGEAGRLREVGLSSFILPPSSLTNDSFHRSCRQYGRGQIPVSWVLRRRLDTTYFDRRGNQVASAAATAADGDG